MSTATATVLSRETAIVGSTVSVQRDGSEPLVGELLAWTTSQLRVFVQGEAKPRKFSSSSVVVFLVTEPTEEELRSQAVADKLTAISDEVAGITEPISDEAKDAAADAIVAAMNAEQPETTPAEPTSDDTATKRTRNAVISGDGEVDVFYTKSGADKCKVTFGKTSVTGTYVVAGGKVTLTVAGKAGKSGTGTTLRRAIRALVREYGQNPGAIRVRNAA
jgi:hypothetical protein